MKSSFEAFLSPAIPAGMRPSAQALGGPHSVMATAYAVCFGSWFRGCAIKHLISPGKTVGPTGAVALEGRQ